MNDRFLILIVDDNANNRFALRELLAQLPDVAIFDAASGEEALLLTVEHAFQLILLDIQMPGMDGFETAHLLQITTRTHAIPIIFLTAVFKSDEFIQRGYTLGAVDYLTKPLDNNIFLNRVKHYHHLHNREKRLVAAMNDMRTMQDDLFQSQKLSALGAMVAGISHELNTPLGNSKLAVSTLQDRLIDISKKYHAGILKRSTIEEFITESMEITNLANRSIERALSLVSSFKQVAIDQTSGQRRTFDLAIVIEEIIATLRPTYKRDPWQFIVDIPYGISLDSYPGPLEQIIINLVQNSIRHGFEDRAHGCITIYGRPDLHDTMLTDQDSTHNDVVLLFSDDGAGIVPENLSRVFDPFFTTHLGRGGSGIGLNIVYRITTTLLGGSIKVDSTPSHGTRFTLRIPRQAPTNM